MSSIENVDAPVHVVAASVRALDLAIERLRSAYAHSQQITVSDSLVMSHLSTCPDRRLTPTELAGRLRTSSGTLTTVIDRLEAAGYAQRIPHPTDGRSVLVALTTAGETSLRANRAPLLQAIRRVVPVTEQRAFASWVDAIAAQLDAASDELAAG